MVLKVTEFIFDASFTQNTKWWFRGAEVRFNNIVKYNTDVNYNVPDVFELVFDIILTLQW